MYAVSCHMLRRLSVGADVCVCVVESVDETAECRVSRGRFIVVITSLRGSLLPAERMKEVRRCRDVCVFLEWTGMYF